MNASIYNELPYIMLINANYIDWKFNINKKPPTDVRGFNFQVVPPGIEPGTQGFSVLCSTN